MAAELDNRRLIEETTTVGQQNEHSTADDPATHATQLALLSRNELFFLGGVLFVHRCDSLVKPRHACTAVERDEHRNKQWTNETQQNLQQVNISSSSSSSPQHICRAHVTQN